MFCSLTIQSFHFTINVQEVSGKPLHDGVSYLKFVVYLKVLVESRLHQGGFGLRSLLKEKEDSLVGLYLCPPATLPYLCPPATPPDKCGHACCAWFVDV